MSLGKHNQTGLRVALDELVGSKALARDLSGQLDRLERGEVHQLIVTRRNEPRAVLITVERFRQLLDGARGFR